MNKSIGALFAGATLVLAACGGGDGGGGGSSAGGVQGEAADIAMSLADDEEFDLDEACVNNLASQLSDADAQAIVDAGTDGDPELSPEGETTTLGILGCIDGDALIDQFITGLAQSGQEVDEECVRENLQDFDLAEITATGEPTSDMISALIECIDLGG